MNNTLAHVTNLTIIFLEWLMVVVWEGRGFALGLQLFLSVWVVMALGVVGITFLPGSALVSTSSLAHSAIVQLNFRCRRK